MVKYRAEVSYFEFPDRLASTFFLDEFGDLEKQRWVENMLLFLTVQFYKNMYIERGRGKGN